VEDGVKKYILLMTLCLTSLTCIHLSAVDYKALKDVKLEGRKEKSDKKNVINLKDSELRDVTLPEGMFDKDDR
jgi:hypothetical protein